MSINLHSNFFDIFSSHSKRCIVTENFLSSSAFDNPNSRTNVLKIVHFEILPYIENYFYIFHLGF